MSKKQHRDFEKKSKIPETITEEESVKLLNVLEETTSSEPRHGKALRNYTMALLMLDAGLRVGELVKLRPDDLTYAETPVDTLLIVPGISKSGRERRIPLTQRIKDAVTCMIDGYWPVRLDSLGLRCFYAKDHTKPITERQVQRIINNASLKTIGRKIHPHVLRHTFASRLMRKTNIRVVQELLGHVSVTSTQIYTHPNSDDFKQAIADIEAPALQT